MTNEIHRGDSVGRRDLSIGEVAASESLLVEGKLNPAWLTVLAGIAGLVFGPSTMTVMCFGVLVGPLRHQFGWTLAQTTLAVTMVTNALVLISPLQGYLIDRFGSRRLVILSVPLFAAAYGSLYFLPDNLYVFYGLWLLIPLSAIGLWPPSYLRATATWFDRRLGLALGITNSGVGVGNVIVPALAGFLVMEYGWRVTYLTLAGLALLLTWPLNLIWLKEYQPKSRATRHAGSGREWKFREVLRSPNFAIVTGVFFLMGAASSGLLVMQVPMLVEAGMKPLAAAGIASVLGMAMIVGRLATGYLLDSFHASKVLMSFILASSTGVMLYAVGITPRDAPIAAVLVGLAIGAEFDGLSYIIPRYFEHSAFGKIYGTVFAIFQLGSGAGIVAIGFSHDRFGSFGPSMWTLSVMMMVAGLLAGRLGPYSFGSMRSSRSRDNDIDGEVPNALE